MDLCPYTAITYDKLARKVSINSFLCKGCGTCAAACPCGAIVQNHFKEEQVFAMIDVVLLGRRCA